ncbi:MAG: Hypothetical protein BHV28_02910 [Candidatus Tokpelaia hoelldobleri]|uniref:N-acetyltransferase domain-containing protein n=1 Tax=Candidatus Tokpelaia hoelldobleri TaxID=1902579 RepID=A0A1U9JT26_9HYPH|nr:MAG: Hypothetical protein BHV28_02910 [Candidatus Tokpelaia hoelldoblerii]
MTMEPVQWRPMQGDDLAAVSRIAAVCHPAFPESSRVLAEKQRLAPDFCLVLADERQVLGYLLAHPWRLGDIPALDHLLGAIPVDADCLYLHDLALLPQTRGGGYAAKVLALLERGAMAAGYTKLALVAVNKSAAFWRKQGFIAVQPAGIMAKKLKTYSDDALYMTK